MQPPLPPCMHLRVDGEETDLPNLRASDELQRDRMLESCKGLLSGCVNPILYSLGSVGRGLLYIIDSLLCTPNFTSIDFCAAGDSLSVRERSCGSPSEFRGESTRSKFEFECDFGFREGEGGKKRFGKAEKRRYK